MSAPPSRVGTRHYQPKTKELFRRWRRSASGGVRTCEFHRWKGQRSLRLTQQRLLTTTTTLLLLPAAETDKRRSKLIIHSSAPVGQMVAMFFVPLVR
ncbi:unnamed protein product [Macrosiphum euphorbiae]|uniref:Uncharacterized protein n=1 Tax=Macrosiphum euphorbiae TaxID=13131 RepID=A0AAV0WLU4_9HEMI|nr:unnamed protein product [Macrosiphum euphorbiae]